MLHELEAWVFADPARLTPQMFNDDATAVATIAAVASEHATPEDIDDAPDTAPSKRLKRVFPRYQKTVHGNRGAEGDRRRPCPCHLPAFCELAGQAGGDRGRSVAAGILDVAATATATTTTTTTTTASSATSAAIAAIGDHPAGAI